jgi:hypothetical protein
VTAGVAIDNAVCCKRVNSRVHRLGLDVARTALMLETIDFEGLAGVTGGIKWRQLGRASLHGAATGALGGGLSGLMAGAVAVPVVGAMPGWVAGAATGGVVGGATSALSDVGTQLHWW